MPESNDGVLESVLVGGSIPDAKEEDVGATEQLMEPGNLALAMTAMGNEFGAAAARRTNRADQLAGDADRLWSTHMTTPTFMAAQAQRMVTESGAGRTRLEANRPAETGAANP